jgi:hypothetical protein
MGGKGSGGTRVGAGRKPKAAPRTISENPAPVPAIESNLALQPPTSLSTAECTLWQALAPHAIAAGTLDASTAEDFKVLIALTVEASELLAARRAAGLNDKGLKFATAYRHTVQRLESKMRAFKLAPIGKQIRPFTPAEPDPFAEFDEPLPLPGARSLS